MPPLPKIHLISPAGSCRPFLAAMGTPSAATLMERVGRSVGPGFRVTGDVKRIEAGEDEAAGGRTDDRARAADIQCALGDDDVAAIVVLRGGAWFSRILPLIDFAALESRRRPIAVFGFSELTTLINIVGATPHGIGVYDMGPAFLTYGLKLYATRHPGGDPMTHRTTTEWVSQRLHPEFDAYFSDIVSMIEGRGTRRKITARLVRGVLPDAAEVTFVGGNLTVLSTLIGSPYDRAIRPAGRWLVIEDFNDKLERIDRFLAHLTLADYWDDCAGILVGDFHKGYEDLAAKVLTLLDFHLRSQSIPVLMTSDVGHIWPMSPLPLNLPLTLRRVEKDRFSIRCAPELLRTI